MKTSFLLLASLFFSAFAFSQNAYVDSLASFQKKYVETHEVVQGEDRKAMHFYPISSDYQVTATFQLAEKAQWITFPTSGKITKVFKVYGTLQFDLQGQPLQLLVYQSQDLMTNDTYKNYLFLPFFDNTTGDETYEGGRYIDLATTDIHDGKVVLDFNKAYNPYCAYVSGKYNCPIPPKENRLPVAIRAGELAYGKSH